MYKSDLLTYSRGVQIRHSHVFTFHTHIYNRRRSSRPSVSFGGSHPQACSPRVVSRHLRSPKEVFAKHRGFWSLGLCFWAINRHLRSPEGAISHLLRCFIGSSPRACAPPWLAFTFGSEGEAFAPRCLSWCWALFGRSCRPPSEPYRQVRKYF